MEEADAELVDRIYSQGEELFKKVLDGASYLDIEDFRKRLIAAIAIQMTKHTVDELKKIYEIKPEDKDFEIA